MPFVAKKLRNMHERREHSDLEKSRASVLPDSRLQTVYLVRKETTQNIP